MLLDEVVLDPGRSVVGLRLVLGTILCKVGMLSVDERFRVRTPTAAVGVRGTEFGVTVSAGGDTLLAVRQGAVAILPAPIDVEELAAGLRTDDPEVSAALAELVALNESCGRAGDRGDGDGIRARRRIRVQVEQAIKRFHARRIRRRRRRKHSGPPSGKRRPTSVPAWPLPRRWKASAATPRADR